MSTVITPNLELLDGPLRVIAGPGTGKTHALTELYAELVLSGRATRDEILVLTFSTSAAAEIGRRLDERLRDSYQRAWVSTFHSFCARLVREHLPDERRLLLSGFQEWVVMRQVLGDMPDEALGELAAVRRSEALAEDVLGFVALLKQNLQTPSQFALLADGGAPGRLRVLARVFSAYQQRLQESHLLDFRDLVALTIGLLESDLKLQKTLRDRFRYVLVDEFQDVDPAQFQLVARIAPPESSPNLAVFGDPDQSIYGFRGTQPQLLSQEFLQRYAARTAELRVSRRCPATALEGAERLLRATHPGRRPVVLETHAEGKVTVARELNAADEAFFVAREIRTLAAEGHAYGDCAILLRSTTTLAAPFEEALKALNVPYEVRGRAGLARNQVVRFLLGYLRALLRPDDAEALAAALESALAGVGRHAVGRLRAQARDEGRALGKVVRALMFRLAEADPQRYPLPWGGTVEPPEEPRPLPPALELLTEQERDSLHRALTAFYALRRRARDSGVGTLANAVLLETGALRQILDDLGPAEREDALADLRTALEAFSEVDEVWTRLHGSAPTLDAVDRLESLLARAIDENQPAPGRPGAVQVMTVHQSKGLEFPVVFVAGFAHGAFPPPARSHPLLDEPERRWLEDSLVGFRPPWPATLEQGLQEEARLAYVAFTRARERLYITYADEYQKTAGPSGFLEPAGFAADRRELTRASAEVTAADVITVAEAETLLALAGGSLAPTQAAALTTLGVDLGFVRDRASGRPFRPHATPPTGADPHHFSATDLNSYLRCPRLYWYEHHPALNPSPAGPEMERGRFLHQVLEDFHNREEEWRHLPLEAQREWLEDALGDHLAGYLERMEGVLDSAREEAEVRRTLDNYIRFATSFQKVRRLGTIATEKKFLLQLDGAEIHGKIDRINDMGSGACEVVDYKTGRGGSMTNNYQRYFGPEAYDVQLALYYLACREGVDEEGVPLALEPRYLSLWFPKEWVYNSIRQALFALGEPVTGKEWLEKQISQEELDRGRGLVASAVERIRAGHFAPEPRPVPGTCLHFTGCRQAAVCPFAGTPNE